MLNYIGRVMQKTGDTVVGFASSSLVRGASKLGTGALKLGVEGAAGLLNKGIKGVQKAAPKLKEVNGKKISDGIGKVVNKTMVGTDDNYKTLGKFINDSKVGKAVNNTVGTNIISDELTPGFRIPRAPWNLNNPKNPKTRMVVSDGSFGLVDAVTDRTKTVIDTAAGIAFGKKIEIGPMVNNNIKNEWLSNKVKKMGTINTGLVKTGSDNFMPFGLKATGIGTTLAIGSAALSGGPEAIKTLNRNRQGTNFDSQPVSVAPQTPAYANNGGATGDLVFALNNLRHGGMM